MRLAIILLIVVTLGGCASPPGTSPTGPSGFPEGPIAGNPNPAAPPAPPSELPSALRIPEGVSIGVGEIQSGPSSGALAAFVGPGMFSDEIALGPNLYAGAAAFADSLLSPLHAMEIPVGLAITNFEQDLTFVLPPDAGGDGTEGTFHVKIDFSPYDADADGENDGCSGNTLGLPICFRMWLDDTRFMAGRFDAYPTDTNRGAGLFKMTSFFESGVESEAPPIGVVYDQDNLLDQSLDLYFFTVFLGSGEGLTFTFVHSAITSDGPELTAERNVKVSGLVDDSGAEEFTPTGSSQYIGEYRVDQPLWRGELHLENVEDPDLSEFDDVCAEITTGSEVSQALCEAIDLDPPADQFAPFPMVEDIVFPPNFPLDPTF